MPRNNNRVNMAQKQRELSILTRKAKALANYVLRRSAEAEVSAIKLRDKEKSSIVVVEAQALRKRIDKEFPRKKK